MKLLNSFGPNPRMVRMFMLEKGIEMPMDEFDLLGAENRGDAYLARNPGGQMPALELDDGTVIAETIAICEYLEEKHPEPVLFGATAEERAQTRMWLRRIEMQITEHMYNGFRFAEGLDLFRDRMVCIPEAADGLKAKAAERHEWLDGLLEGKEYITGKFSAVDMVLYCCMDFCKDVGQPINRELKNLSAWYDRVASRPSAAGSLHPGSAEAKMAG
ncbi:MAG: glutathione S-transferase family protein [Gammaproteobacteria bacterium]